MRNTNIKLYEVWLLYKLSKSKDNEDYCDNVWYSIAYKVLQEYKKKENI